MVGKLPFGLAGILTTVRKELTPTPEFTILKKLKKFGDVSYTFDPKVKKGTWLLRLDGIVLSEEKAEKPNVEQAKTLPLNRILIVASGLFLGDVSSSTIGAIFGGEGGVRGVEWRVWNKVRGDDEVQVASKDRVVSNAIGNLEARVGNLKKVTGYKKLDELNNVLEC